MNELDNNSSSWLFVAGLNLENLCELAYCSIGAAKPLNMQTKVMHTVDSL
jgi:hypothetical protein